MVYPDWYKRIPPVGCGCVRGCSNLNKCSCAKRNGGKFSFNKNKAIVSTKTLIYECGPHCKCLPSCCNRVSQSGIQFRFEVFKTKDKGWGVRSRDMIPKRSFICEYTGMLINFEEAEKRAENDEYLFDLWNYSHDTTKNKRSKKRKSSSANGFDSRGFTIDAARVGNFARFINHSCSPNLIAQKVLYDHSDKRIPHMVLFAMENIPPMTELTYNYNYKVNQVEDSDGNIRKKVCLCGAMECRGRMY
ncbi:histone-lysine N-methyltransferase, H3 lysine-9 specific SUVH5-like [Lotus japonicus]|uniref:histone-lysine N-methyltransferase, H3 lysine-9 specific SUVH5-like n=1 Tax=Lotus japonicus TaxID=34305 RepID=UPI00258CC95A|nr:histone-lysine N-methyltransferase, H3 lysine-9 specific SUVH5-like [Lotus japonicus]